MAYGLQVFDAGGVLVWDSTTIAGGVVAGVQVIAASTAPTFTYAAFPGRTAKVLSSAVGKDTGVTVDYAPGYPRVTVASRPYVRKLMIVVF